MSLRCLLEWINLGGVNGASEGKVNQCLRKDSSLRGEPRMEREHDSVSDATSLGVGRGSDGLCSLSLVSFLSRLVLIAAVAGSPDGTFLLSISCLIFLIRPRTAGY
jgi:hypothetical protein